jgi:hypothetical protein
MRPVNNTQDETGNNKSTVTCGMKAETTEHKTNGHGTITDKDKGEQRAHIYT